MKWIRGDELLLEVAEVSNPIEWGNTLRSAIDDIRADIQPEDTLEFSGKIVADFGKDYIFHLPACNYKGKKRQEFITRVTIDGSEAKPGASTGFILPNKASFYNFKFTGNCHNVYEDGGMIGWNTGMDAEVSFDYCVLNGRYNNDWLFYDWSQGTKKMSFTNSTFYFARQGIALNNSGGAQYDLTVDNCKFYGNANYSQSYGESSRNNEVSGGVLAGVVMRSGTANISNCQFWMQGLNAVYGGGTGFSAPRMACVTDHYYSSSSSHLKINLKNMRVHKLVPGVATVVNDVDVRWGTYTLDNSELISAAQAKMQQILVDARGGSGPAGQFLVWEG